MQPPPFPPFSACLVESPRTLITGVSKLDAYKLRSRFLMDESRQSGFQVKTTGPALASMDGVDWVGNVYRADRP